MSDVAERDVREAESRAGYQSCRRQQSLKTPSSVGWEGVCHICATFVPHWSWPPPENWRYQKSGACRCGRGPSSFRGLSLASSSTTEEV